MGVLRKMSDQEQFAALKAIYPDAVLVREGGVAAAYLPAASFRAGGVTTTMQLLLFPAFHTGYVTRLFFERKISGKGANWTQHSVVSRTWWAPSFKDVAPTLPWPAMLFAHLRAVE